jgi:hypothetical protein
VPLPPLPVLLDEPPLDVEPLDPLSLVELPPLLDETPLDVLLLPLDPPLLPVPLDEPPLLDPLPACPPDVSRPVDAPHAPTTTARPTIQGHRSSPTTRWALTRRLWPLWSPRHPSLRR